MENIIMKLYEDYKKDWCLSHGYESDTSLEELEENGECYACFEEWKDNEFTEMLMNVDLKEFPFAFLTKVYSYQNIWFKTLDVKNYAEYNLEYSSYYLVVANAEEIAKNCIENSDMNVSENTTIEETVNKYIRDRKKDFIK